MTGQESQQSDGGRNEPIFGRSGLRDAWDAVKYNFAVFVFSTFIVFFVLELNRTTALSAFLGLVSDDVDLSNFLLFAAYALLIGVFICSALSLLVYAVHSTVMTGVSGLAAFANERRRDLSKYVARFTFLASLLSSAFTVLFLAAVYVMGAGLRGSGSTFIWGLWLWPASMIVAVVIASLISTWPVSVFFTGQSSWRRAWARGQRSFGYVAIRNILLLPLTCWLWVATSLNLSVGLSEPTVQSGSLHDLVDVKATLFTSLLASVWCILQAVIVSRAFAIGEARLSRSE
ncbi:MAG: hypothetical protein RIG26_13420 [Thalassospira sp.]|uniref:hypothetical protein n=1 Tax=Thalassospira sp. TaxID=1912094 RepID=UPI0032EC3FDB